MSHSPTRDLDYTHADAHADGLLIAAGDIASRHGLRHDLFLDKVVGQLAPNAVRAIAHAACRAIAAAPLGATRIPFTVDLPRHVLETLQLTVEVGDSRGLLLAIVTTGTKEPTPPLTDLEEFVLLELCRGYVSAARCGHLAPRDASAIIAALIGALAQDNTWLGWLAIVNELAPTAAAPAQQRELKRVVEFAIARIGA